MEKKVLKTLVVTTILCVCITALFITSCEKDNTKPVNSKQLSTVGISIKEGALSFETVGLFFKTTELLGSMTPDERDSWE